MKNKKRRTQDEKRRILLNQQQKPARFVVAENTSATGGGVKAKIFDGNRRFMAFVLAVIFLLTAAPTAVFFTLHGKAASTDIEYGTVTMDVRANGANHYTTAEIDSGVIADNVDTATFANTLPTGAEFVRAFVIDSVAGTETEIAGVAKVITGNSEKTYYSIGANSEAGTELKEDTQSLLLIMAAKHEVTLNATQGGTVTTSAVTEGGETYVWGGDALRIQATPAQDFELAAVTYVVNGTTKNATIINGSATIPANDIAGDITVNVSFAPVSSYRIQDARYYNNSKYYPDYYNFDNHGGTTLSETTKGSQNNLGTVQPGQTAVFYIYSQKNTTSSQVWAASMISVNGIDAKLPKEPGTFREEGNIKVTYVKENHNFSDESNSPRALYKVEVSGVHEDLEVNYYFTNTNTRRIIIKDLRGIAETGASVEERHLRGFDYHYYYFFNTNAQHIYETFYRDSSTPSDNLITYRVKPGYNPYDVHVSLAVDNGDPSDTSVKNYDGAGTVEEVIFNTIAGSDGRYNTAYRHWGRNSTLTNKEVSYNNKNLMLTDIYLDTDHTWYGVALAQQSSYNQQLYLSVTPYNYQLQLETTSSSATLSDSGYTNQGNGVYLETASHTVEDSNAYFVTPTADPTWDNNHVFEGWQLIDQTGDPVSGQIYEKNQQIPMNEAVLETADGDVTNSNLRIRLRAVWSEIDQAATTSISTKVYYQDPNGDKTLEGKTYRGWESTEIQPTNEYVSILNLHLDDFSALKYYELNSTSKVSSRTVAQTSASEIPEDNQLSAIYDLRLYTMDVTKKVTGRVKTTAFDITVTLTRPSDYPETLDTMKDFISRTQGVAVAKDDNNGTLTFSKSFAADETIELGNVPYGWTYEITEAQNPNDYQTVYSMTPNTGRRSADGTVLSGTVEVDMDITVTNQRKNDDPNIVSDKWLTQNGDGTYNLTMETYALGTQVTTDVSDPVPLDIALVIDQSASMGTEDINATYTAVPNKTSWTVKDATSGKTYFYKVGDKYYPVQAQEGTLYEQVDGAVRILQMIGTGHDGLTVGVNGSPVHFNVPTKYYTLDANHNPHKVWVITAGEFLEYAAYMYYYTDVQTPMTIYDYDIAHYLVADGWTKRTITSVVNEEHPFKDGAEWVENIYWTGSWQASDIYKANDRTTRNLFPSGYCTKATSYNGSAKWMSLAANGQVCFVGKNGATITDCDNSRLTYSWISNGSNANVNGDLYLPKDGTNYNGLYYINDNGDKEPIGQTVYLENDSAYNGTLYEVTGTKRVTELQNSVRAFTQMVAQKAKDDNVDHKIGIIGFAGNKFPTNSVGQTAYNKTKYDYTNTGLFLNNTFKNYQGFTTYHTTSDRYINMHYYIKDGSNYVPVYYSGGWKRLDTGASINSSDTFYEPDYEDLSAEDYQAALVDASAETDGAYDGTVNSNLTNAINNFGYYGGSYTSYGIHMANELFANNDNTYTDSTGAEQPRKRVIVVFTDGEPGALGYDSSIAGEALAEDNMMKYSTSDGGLNATIYTIGLFYGNSSNVSDDVNTFMSGLSSESAVPLVEVYGASQTSNSGYGNAVSTDGGTNLDGDNTYFFKNLEDGKIYAVTAQKDGLSTLGFWQKTDSSYIRQYPKTASNDNREIDGTTVITFYNASGNAVYDTGKTDGIDWSGNTVYFTSRTQRDASTAIKFEYRWYDSNGKVRDPIKNTYGPYDTTRNTYQFYTLNYEQMVDNPDGQQYYFPTYYDAEHSVNLQQVFEQISQTVTTNGTTTALTPDNTIIRDILSNDFDWSQDSQIITQTVEGTRSNSTAVPTFDPTAHDVTLTSTFDTNTRTINVSGFDFSDNYIDPTHPGKKLRITVTNLVPNNVGGIFESNQGECGLIVKVADPDDVTQIEEKFVDAFPNPSISRYKYTIGVDGDDTETTYNTAFAVTDKDGNSISRVDFDTLNYCPDNADTWDDGEIQNVDGKTSRSVIYEEIRDVDQFETLLQGNDFKHGDTVPDDYQVTATVTGTGMNTTLYTYTKDIDGTQTDYGNSASFSYTLPKDNSTAQISSDMNSETVSIQEITQASDSQNDYSDPTKKFTIQLTLRDGNNNAVGFDAGNVVFDNNGHATLTMKHNDAVTFEIPRGYSLSADVDSITQDGYYDTYRVNGDPVADGGGTLREELPATTINAYTSIQVINSIDAPVVTGVNEDNSSLFGIVLGAIAGISLAAAAGYVYLRRRKLGRN